MGTVTSQLTRLGDMEGTLTSVSIGGGQGASANTDIFLQGAQSLARRTSNVTLGGFLYDDGAGNNVSAANTHVGLWVWVTHYAVLTDLRARLADGGNSNNYDEHQFPLTEYPNEGGWVRIWVDVSRTPEATGGTGLTLTNLRYFGPVISIPAVGGNAQNLVLDAVDATATGLLLTGTTSVFSDLVTADANATNKYGVISSLSGILFCRARITIGSATATEFSESNFVLIFPQQALVSNTFMGLTVDLQNAATDVEFIAGSFQSPGAKKGDFIVTGTAGILLVDGCTFTGMRILTLTSAVTFTDNILQTSGLLTQSGAEIQNCSFVAGSGTASVLCDDITKLTDCSFVSSGTGHAIEGFSAAGDYTLTNLTFSGYASVNGTTGNETIYVTATTGTVNLTVIGGSVPSIRTAGATVNVIAGLVTITIEANVSLVDAEIRIYDLDNNPTGSYGTELSGVESHNAATYVFNASSSNLIHIQIMKSGFEEYGQSYTVPSVSSTVNVNLRLDVNA
jgi:hypothetical protein